MIGKNLSLLCIVLLAGCQIGRSGLPERIYTDGNRVATPAFLVDEFDTSKVFHLVIFSQRATYGIYSEQVNRDVAILSEKVPNGATEAAALFRTARPPRIITHKIEERIGLDSISSAMLESEQNDDGVWWVISIDPVVLAHGPSMEPETAMIKRPRSDGEILTTVNKRVSLITQRDLNAPVDHLYMLDHYPQDPGFIQGDALNIWITGIKNTTRKIALQPNTNVGQVLTGRREIWGQDSNEVNPTP